MLSKSAILKANDIESQIVPVPEWDGEVKIYGLTCGEKDQFESSLVSVDVQTGKRSITMKDATARLCVMCIRDEEGKRIFDESDVVQLAKKSGKAIQRVYEVAEKLSGLAKGEVEEMVKNSEKTQM